MMEKNKIFENIMSRTSVRSYTDMSVEPEKMEMMLRAGMVKQAPLAIVVCGCLDKTKDKWKEENISYNKWMEKNS